ncbi:extracellular solute-binding protein [Kitasatospora aureofaciens]|uniref:sugar ABC transporter substrate-binding protein n=1 Tax=Kitasatospora aureofaciens TaxID=1894 RepID=UPI0037C74C8C
MATSRTLAAAAVCAALALGAVTGCSSSGGFGDPSAKQSSGANQNLNVLIATSGEAETAAVKAATADWARRTGNTVTVQIAANINQQLGQAFAGGNPPDLFYVNSDQFANYAKGGSLYAYGDRIPDADDFAEQLRKAFSYQGKLTCLPKDSSTLGLAVNTDLWKQAGLTEADYPTSWQQLSDDAAKLTRDGVTGLVTAPDHQRLGALLKQAGGWITDPGQTAMTADSPANKQALEFLQGMMKAGSAKYVSEVDAGWGGEALGKGKAAMTIEGNWLKGAMAKDYPGVPYKVLPLPAGPAGPGTLSFSNCWGIAAKSSHRAAGVDLVKHLTSADQQLEFAKAFGVMPSRTSALAAYAATYPESKAWVDGVAHAQPPVTVAGFNQVLTQFDTDLQSLRTGDPATILAALQRNGEQALEHAG